MNEKGLVVLEQYELDVRNARRGRGSFLVDTDRGLKLLTEYSGTEGRLEFQAEVMGELREKGLERLDFPVRNKEGGFLVKDREEITYLLREWHEGRECEVRNLSEVEEAVRTLAYLHRNFRTAPKEGRAAISGRTAEPEYCIKGIPSGRRTERSLPGKMRSLRECGNLCAPAGERRSSSRNF